MNLTLVELKIVAVGTLSLELRFSKSIVVEFDRTQNKVTAKRDFEIISNSKLAISPFKRALMINKCVLVP